MHLIERDEVLACLGELLTECARGDGRLALVAGEAGAGKSSLVRAFVSRLPPSIRVLNGACDPLTTPRPLGPFLDIAGDPVSVLHVSRAEQLTACRELLIGEPTVAVIEDVHWADEATLDALRHIARRLRGAPLLLLATFRDDEVGSGHPLRLLLGDLAAVDGVSRLTVPPLSPAGVEQLARGKSADPRALYRLTGGNAFYVTEVLAGGGAGIPLTVRDAVLARVARLSEGARSLLQEAALIGPRPEVELLRAVPGSSPEALDECIERGLLRHDGRALEFRHELARAALADSVPAHRAAAIHARLARALIDRAGGNADTGRIAHHAEAAGDHELALEYSERAGSTAREAGAHREAAEQFQRALRACPTGDVARRAMLLDRLGLELHLTARLNESIDVRSEAAALWSQLGEHGREALSRTTLASALFGTGRNAEANAAVADALALVQDTECPELASVLSRLAYQYMLERENELAVSVGTRAIEIGERFHVSDAVILAKGGMGAALILLGDHSGIAVLEASRQLARETHNDRGQADALVNLGSALGEMYELDLAEPYLLEGIDFCERRDIDHSRLYCMAWLAIVRMLRGRWSEATDLAEEVLAFPSSSVISQIMAWLVLGRVRARRGDPDARHALNAALELAAPTATLQRLGPVRAARAEAAWLAGDTARVAAEAGEAYQMALEHRHPWHSGELAYWQGLGGGEADPVAWITEPWKRHLAGDFHGAAGAWAALGCRYEAARALADSADELDLREALTAFESLGARPMAQLTARRLRELGARAIPRGPRRTTRANAAGLTERELEVLMLMADGCQNAAIAERLSLSTRTVDHHVAAILRKLDAHTRGEATARAATLGLTQR